MTQPPASEQPVPRIAILVTRWYPEVMARLQDAALETLAAAGIARDAVQVIEVPGAFELPQVASWVARAEDAEGILALGCIVQGETPHFEYVARACADGLQQVALETGIPIGLGVITADTLAQAEARSQPGGGTGTSKGGNKGIEAAEAVLAMVKTYRLLEDRRRT
jgi:6,7-dimethyl-8-ribityllumazine synthase